MGKFGYGERNERGERLLEFAALNDLYICSTKFKHKPSRKWTWESPNGRDRNMIDMILVDKRRASSVCSCRSFQGADISSDHSLVLSSFKSRLKRIPAKKLQRPKYNLDKLADSMTQLEFQCTMLENCKEITVGPDINQTVDKQRCYSSHSRKGAGKDANEKEAVDIRQDTGSCG